MIAAALLACAVNVAPSTLEAVIRVESGGNALALNVNGLRVQPPPARDIREAAQIAAGFIARGYSVDIGLMQVSSRNLIALGVTVRQVLDPCTNIRSGAKILTADYAAATRTLGEGQVALQAALSAYNTGDFYRGLVNGYVAHYYGPGVMTLANVRRATIVSSSTIQHMLAPRPADPFSADTNVYTREAADVGIE